ncbi:hypothetical protein C8F01DRAFT_376116 [Mycena amicta]|nr:hypothetical protein C8F01DRAFT_376116 [Mycena amicta]
MAAGALPADVDTGRNVPDHDAASFASDPVGVTGVSENGDGRMDGVDTESRLQQTRSERMNRDGDSDSFLLGADHDLDDRNTRVRSQVAPTTRNLHRPEVLLRSRPITVHSPYTQAAGFPRKASRSRSVSRPAQESVPAPPQKAPQRVRTDSSFARRPSSSRVSHRSQARHPQTPYDPHAYSYHYYGYPYPTHDRSTYPYGHPQTSHAERHPFVAHDPFGLRLPVRAQPETLPMYNVPSASSLHAARATSENASSITSSVSSLATLPQRPAGSFVALKLLYLIFIAFPHQLYLHLLLLRIPHLYFSRIALLFEDAGLSKEDLPILSATRDINAVPHLVNFHYAWDAFLDTLVKEWKAQAVISALLLSAILSLLQLSLITDSISRTTALLALICALLSVSFASIYVFQFGGGAIRKIWKAAKIAEEAQKQEHRISISIIWNTWIFLAVPAIWFAWSIILFLASITIFVWRTYTLSHPFETPTRTRTIAGAIALSAVLLIGVVCLCGVLWTFRRFGDREDRRWQRVHADIRKNMNTHRAASGVQTADSDGAWHTRDMSQAQTDKPRPDAVPAPGVGIPQVPSSVPSRGRSVRYHQRTKVTTPITRTESSQAPPIDSVPPDLDPTFPAIRVLEMRYTDDEPLRVMPFPDSKLTAEDSDPRIALVLRERGIREDDWRDFTTDLCDTWNNVSDPPIPPFPIDPLYLRAHNRTTLNVDQLAGDRQAPGRVACTMHVWNKQFFRARRAEVVLCKYEYASESESESSAQSYAVYLVSLRRELDSEDFVLGSLPVLDDGTRGTLLRMHEKDSSQGKAFYCTKIDLGPGKETEG